MPRKSKTAQEIGYARSFWDTIRDIEDEFKSSVFVTITPEHRPGVLKIRMSCAQVLAKFGSQPVDTSIAVIWPNARDQTFVGCMWDTAMKLFTQAEEQSGLITPRTGEHG